MTSQFTEDELRVILSALVESIYSAQDALNRYVDARNYGDVRVIADRLARRQAIVEKIKIILGGGGPAC